MLPGAADSYQLLALSYQPAPVRLVDELPNPTNLANSYQLSAPGRAGWRPTIEPDEPSRQLSAISC